MAAVAFAQAPCATSYVRFGSATPSSATTAAMFDTVAAQGRVQWDMSQGRVYMYSAGWLGGPYGDVFDNFDVTGVPAGTPVNVIATLTIDGAVWTSGCGGSGCGGLYWVEFRHGTDSLRVIHQDHLFSGRSEHHDVLQLPLTIVAGQPEELRLVVHGQRTPGGAHESEATCVLSFTGLAEGMAIASCKGFAGTAVPVQRTSWGRLKTFYR